MANKKNLSTGPKVSVVLPTYNQLHFLPRAIDSLLNQTFGDFELIIVNDGSTDGTKDYLNTLADPRITVKHQDNARLPKALNAGFRSARGELLTWVSSDNYCAPAFLETLVGALDSYPNAGMAYSGFAWVDENDQVINVIKDQDMSFHSLLAMNPGNASFMYRKKCQDKVGFYDPKLIGAEDWDMWIRIVERFETVCVPETLYHYRIHEQTMTRQMRPEIRANAQAVFMNAMTRKADTLDLLKLTRKSSSAATKVWRFSTRRLTWELHSCARRLFRPVSL